MRFSIKYNFALAAALLCSVLVVQPVSAMAGSGGAEAGVTPEAGDGVAIDSDGAGVGGVSAIEAAADKLLGMPEVDVTKKAIPVGISLVLSNSVGMGTFVKNQDTNEALMPLYAMSLSFAPMWQIYKGLTLSGRFDLSREMVSNYASSVTYPGQVFPSDTSLRLNHGSLFSLGSPATGRLNLGGGVTMILPTSIYSRKVQQMYTALAPNFNASFMVGGFVLSFSESYTKYFNKYKTLARDLSEFTDYPTGHPRTAEELPDGLFMMGGMNRNWGLTHSLAMSQVFLRDFSATLSFAVVNRFYYKASDNGGAEDVAHSQYANPDENQRDFTMGAFQIEYRQNNHLQYAIGVSSLQPAKTADGQSLRFPFYDFVSPANNFSSIYLDIVGSF